MGMHEAALALVDEGARWSGSEWTTCYASKWLHKLTQVPLVTADFKQYGQVGLRTSLR